MLSTSKANKKLPTLERNILKYRIFEMTLILFQIEEFKKYVVASIRATDDFNSTIKKSNCESEKSKNSADSFPNQRLPPNIGKLYEKAWKVLIADGIITQEEKTEIVKLIDYRDDIAHRIHLLTCDLNKDILSQEFLHRKKNEATYDYQALTRIRYFRDKFQRAWNGVHCISLNTELFESTEATLKQELKVLDKRIKLQYKKRKEDMESLSALRK